MILQKIDKWKKYSQELPFKKDERANRLMNGELQLLKHENQGMKNKVHWLRNCRFKCNSMD
jgi:hypothetical protein